MAACLLFAHLSSGHVRGLNPHPEQVLATAAQFTGQRETSPNGGAFVTRCHVAAGLKPGCKQPWCGCFQALVWEICDLLTPRWPALAANWFPADPRRTYYVRGRRGSVDAIECGDQVGFYSEPQHRINHVGMKYSPTPTGLIVSEGNAGDAVRFVRRTKASIYAAANWRKRL